MIVFSTSIPPFAELKQTRRDWTWQEIRWGKRHGLLHAKDAIAYAFELLSDSRKDFSELLDLAIEDWYSEAIDQKITILCDFEKKESEEKIIFNWKKAILEWFYYNIEDDKVLQERINSLYADLDYPEDMQSLVNYMPRKSNGFSNQWSIKVSLKAYIDSYENW